MVYKRVLKQTHLQRPDRAKPAKYSGKRAELRESLWEIGNRGCMTSLGDPVCCPSQGSPSSEAISCSANDLAACSPHHDGESLGQRGRWSGICSSRPIDIRYDPADPRWGGCAGD